MFSLTPFYFLLATTLIGAAPVPRDVLDAADLLKNGQEAQDLNAQFQNLTTSDACTSGQAACIGGALANCVNDKWQTQDCPSSLSCFAVPLVTQTGTNVTCTSEKNALSIIASTGASNEIAVASNSTDDSCDPDTDDGDDSNSGDDSENGDDSGSDTCDSDDGDKGSGTTTITKGGEVTVTVTAAPTSTVSITVPPSGTATLPPTTTTLGGAAAASLLSLLSAQGGVAVTTIVNGGNAAAASASAAPAASSSASSGGSIIQLTEPAAAPSAADNGSGASASGSAVPSASSLPIIQLTQPAAAATPLAANNANAAASTQPVLTLLPTPSSAANEVGASSAATNPFTFSDY